MKSSSLTILKWEFENNYRFPIFESIILIITILIVGSGKILLTFHDIQSSVIHVGLFVSSFLDTFMLLGILVLGVFLSNSFAGAFERGELKVLLSFPVSRIEIILFKCGLNFLVFFLVYAILTCCAIIFLSPFVLLTPVFPILLLGLGLYFLFFTSIFLIVSIGVKNLKTAFIINVFFCLLFFGIAPLFLRASGFLRSFMVSFVEWAWPSFTFSSSVQVPFMPVLLGIISVTFVFLAFSVIYFSFFMDVS